MEVLSFFILVITQLGYSQKLGELCLKQNTRTLGLCTPAARCESAKREYALNRIIPTFCERFETTIVVCCSDNTLSIGSVNVQPPTQPLRAPSPEPAPRPTNNELRVSEKKCAEYSNDVVENINVTAGISTSKCDYNKQHLIVGGEDAERGEFPHMAAIGWINLEGTYSFLCGGSLISPNFVMTAAHCSKYAKMRIPRPVIVRLGDQNIKPEKFDGANPIDVKIKSIQNHPLYKSPGKYNDIMLLELETEVKFEAAIRPACLWSKPDFEEYTTAVATGWGITDPRTQRTSDELRKVSLSLFNNSFCKSVLTPKRNRNWPDGFRDTQVCAGELRGGKDTCQGDSGSPLQVVSRQNKCIFYVVAITSFGPGCALKGTPAIYTRVSSYLDWIESVVWPEG